MKQIQQFLETLGLTKNEISIYITSLGIGQTTSSILGKKVGLTRSTARYTCQSLVNKNIMNCIQRKDHFLFTAELPRQLKNILQKQKLLIEGKMEQFDSILTKLEKQVTPYAILPKVKYYQGVSGIIDIFEDVLMNNVTIYGSMKIDNNIHPEVLHYIDTIYTPKRKKLKIPTYAIFNNNSKMKSYMMADLEVNRHTLLLPESDYPFPGSCYIYGNKVAFFSFTKHNLSGIIIENKEIVETQLSFFKLAWKIAKEHSLNEKK